MEGTPDLHEMIGVMNQHFGTILIEEMTGAGHADLRRWLEGGVVHVEQEARLHTGYQAFMMIAERDGFQVARGWMFGMCPQLDDENPMLCISRDRHRDVLAAARSYINNDTFE